MDPAEILSFDIAAQADMEQTFPAVIRFAGTVLDIACAGGSLHNTDARAMPGGVVAEYSVFFRVQRALSTPPSLGAYFQWKRQGEANWRPVAAVMRVVDPRLSTAFTIYGSNPAQ